MPWLLLDLALVLLALLALVVAGLRVWRGVKALGRQLGAASTAVGAASEELSRLQQGPASSAAATAAAPVAATAPAGAGRPRRVP